MKKQRIVSSGSKRTAGFYAGGGGAQKFTQLQDAPHSYTGQAGKIPVVNDGETALEFKTEPAIDRHDLKVTSGDGDPQFLDNKIDFSGSPLTKRIVDYPGGKAMNVYENPLYGGVFQWLSSFDKFWDPTGGLPDPETDGGVFISLATANGWGKNTIYTWNPTDEIWEAPSDQTFFAAFNKDDGYIYIWNNLVWRPLKKFFVDPVNRLLPEPPEFFFEGDRFIVIAGTGDWLGHDNEIAEYINGDWIFTPPAIGMCVLDQWTKNIYSYNAGEGNYWARVQRHDFAGDIMSTENLHEASIIARIQTMVADGFFITSAPAEIATLTAKESLTKADLFVTEDSEADPVNAKKKTSFEGVGLSLIAEADGAEAESAAFARGARIVIRTDLL